MCASDLQAVRHKRTVEQTIFSLMTNLVRCTAYDPLPKSKNALQSTLVGGQGPPQYCMNLRPANWMSQEVPSSQQHRPEQATSQDLGLHLRIDRRTGGRYAGRYQDYGDMPGKVLGRRSRPLSLGIARIARACCLQMTFSSLEGPSEPSKT